MNEAKLRAAQAQYFHSVGIAPTETWITLGSTSSKLRIQEVGSGPPIVFIHGTTNDGTSWAPLAAHLAGFRCLLVDRPGCGLSELPTTPSTTVTELAHMADTFVADVLDALGIDRAAVVSTSYGGYFAFRSAAATPDRVERVIELGWTVGAPVGRLIPAMRMAGIRPLAHLMTRVPPPNVMVKTLLKQLGVRDAALVEPYHALLRYTPTFRNEAVKGPTLLRVRGDLSPGLLLSDELLQSIRCPVHLIWGEQDVFGGAEVARAFAARISGATLEIMEGAGHAPWIDNPVLVSDRIRGWI